MIRWTLDEFLTELEADTARHVLFVEGGRDIAFWRKVVPDAERGQIMIVPIALLEIDWSFGGERGRMVHIAPKLHDQPRVRFFADADWDRILEREVPLNVTLTDGRDLESYALTDNCLSRINLAFNRDLTVSSTLIDYITKVLKSISALRIIDDKEGMKLPFEGTIDAKYLRRHLSGDFNDPELNFSAIVQTLLQKAGISQGVKDALLVKVESMLPMLENLGARQIIHGKDFINLLACVFGLERHVAEAIVFMSLDGGELRLEPNLTFLEGWVRAA